MNASTPTYAAYFNHIDSIELSIDVITACSHAGDCSKDIQRCLLLPEIKLELSEIDTVSLRKELYQYGIWEPEELQNHEDNLSRILWIAADKIKDELSKKE